MIKYVKYLFTTLLLGILIASVIAGGHWMWAGLAMVFVIMIGGDALTGEDLSEPVYAHTWILNAMLFVMPVFLLSALLLFAWMAGSGNSDFLLLGRTVRQLTGYDLFAARAGTIWSDYIGGALGLGLAVAGYGTNIAHELTHRTKDKVSLIVGRWLLAFSCNADFSIEHVYGHHLHVATQKDPATARRGENIYSFIVRSIIYSHVSAWRLEKNRLKKKGFSLYSWRNLMFRGYLMSIALAAVFFAAAGWAGVALFLGQALWAKVILEIVNYMEHYGLVRIEGKPVEPRHSWNTNKIVSSLVLFSLTRHSAHHEKGDLPFWKLKPYKDAPEMPFGYLTTIVLCLVPPLWFKIMAPKIQDWDARFASAPERKLAAKLEKKSAWSDMTLVGA